ncbi:hypothetical protein MBLNU230_g7665t1 [Neophaeotheca triangularis]
MDSESMRTASSYVNNLLLARGLLPTTSQIDFAKPSRESRAQIINLVHDLILRNDRDAEQREKTATTLRTLRSEHSRAAADLDRVSAKSEEHARNAVQARSAERAAVQEVKRVERGLKTAQELAGKLKSQLAQVRAQCANDVRKRDAELARLKAHLQGGQRGARGAAGSGAPGLTIVGAGGAGGKGAAGGAGRRAAGFDASVRAVGDPAYSLKQETTDFLTQLSQSLSDENDGLIGLIREALGTMKELLGQPAIPDSAIGSRGSEDYEQANNKNETEMLHALPASYSTLSADLSATLGQLKTILTNPNFVPISEVEAREDEIAHLREGWERMEQRWRDVLMMMEGWRRKMDGGATIDLDDLTKGMGLASPQRDGNYHHFRASKRRSMDESVLEDSINDGAEEEAEEASKILSPPSPEQESPQQQPLGDIFSPVVRKRKSSTPTKRKRSALEPPEYFDIRPSTAPVGSPKPRTSAQSLSPRRSRPQSQHSLASPTRSTTRKTARGYEQLDRSPNHDHKQAATEPEPTFYDKGERAPAAEQYKQQEALEDQDRAEQEEEEQEEETLTIAQKLAAAEAEAEAAAAGLSKNTSSSTKTANFSRPSSARKTSSNQHQHEQSPAAPAYHDDDDDDTLGMLPSPPPLSPVKRTGVKGRAKRRSRKSTLSPEELAGLLGMED